MDSPEEDYSDTEPLSIEKLSKEVQESLEDQSKSKISLSNSLQKQVDNYKKQKNLVEKPDGTITIKDARSGSSLDSERAKEKKKADLDIQQKFTRLKQLQQFDVEWMDI